jgi:hypothetical protein
MAYNFVSGDRDQPFLLSPDLRDWLPEGHLAWCILDVTDQLNLTPFYRAHRDDGHGRPAYDPKLLLGVLLYAYCLGVRSSRQIERRCVVRRHELLPVLMVDARVPRVLLTAAAGGRKCGSTCGCRLVDGGPGSMVGRALAVSVCLAGAAVWGVHVRDRRVECGTDADRLLRRPERPGQTACRCKGVPLTWRPSVASWRSFARRLGTLRCGMTRSVLAR